MSGNLPKFLEGGPKDYGAWLLGDDDHRDLTAYHEGEDVELDVYALDFLDNFTHPKSRGVMVYEDWSVSAENGTQGENGTLNFYMPPDQIKERWDISRNHQLLTDDQTRALGYLALPDLRW